MKLIYKAIIFFAVFHIVVLMINSLNVFPAEATLYSDADTAEYDFDDPADLVAYIFPAIGGKDITFSILVAGFTTLGAFLGIGLSVVTHSLAPIAIYLLGATMIPMMLNSWGFFNKLLYNWDSEQLVYLAIALGVGLIIISLITIIEMATHGRSG